MKQAHQPAIAMKQASEPAVAMKQANEPAIAMKQANEPAIAMKLAHQPAIAMKLAHQPATTMKQTSESAIAMKQASEPAIAMKQANEPAIAMKQACESATVNWLKQQKSTHYNNTFDQFGVMDVKSEVSPAVMYEAPGFYRSRDDLGHGETAVTSRDSYGYVKEVAPQNMAFRGGSSYTLLVLLLLSILLFVSASHGVCLHHYR